MLEAATSILSLEELSDSLVGVGNHKERKCFSNRNVIFNYRHCL